MERDTQTNEQLISELEKTAATLTALANSGMTFEKNASFELPQSKFLAGLVDGLGLER